MLSLKYKPDQILSSVDDWKKPTTKAILTELASFSNQGDKEAQGLLKSMHQRFISLLVSQKLNVVAEYATGTGKTGCGIESMKLFPGKWLIVYYRVTHKTTWTVKIPGVTIEFIGYKSLKSKVGKSYTGVILDEVHHITSASVEALRQIQTQYAIGLSALIPSEKKVLLMSWRLFHTQRLSLTQAIQSGLLPAPLIIACPVTLKTDVASIVYKVQRYKNANWEPITYSMYANNPAYHTRFANYEVSCTQQQYYDLLNGDILYWKNQYFADEKKTEWKYIKWQRLAGDRKRFLSVVKNNVVRAIHKFILERQFRFVVFEIDSSFIQTLTQTNILSHKNKDNAKIIADFNEGRINQLYSVDILNESSNLENLEFMLLGVLNTIQVANIQRIGRSLRGDFPILAVPYVKGSSDEKNFTKFIAGLEAYVFYAQTMKQVKETINEQTNRASN